MTLRPVVGMGRAEDALLAAVSPIYRQNIVGFRAW